METQRKKRPVKLPPWRQRFTKDIKDLKETIADLKDDREPVRIMPTQLGGVARRRAAPPVMTRQALIIIALGGIGIAIFMYRKKR